MVVFALTSCLIITSMLAETGIACTNRMHGLDESGGGGTGVGGAGGGGEGGLGGAGGGLQPSEQRFWQVWHVGRPRSGIWHIRSTHMSQVFGSIILVQHAEQTPAVQFGKPGPGVQSLPFNFGGTGREQLAVSVH